MATARHLVHEAEALTTTKELSDLQVQALNALRLLGGIASTKDIGDRMGYEGSNLITTLDGLFVRGYVRRAHAMDGRTRIWILAD